MSLLFTLCHYDSSPNNVGVNPKIILTHIKHIFILYSLIYKDVSRCGSCCYYDVGEQVILSVNCFNVSNYYYCALPCHTALAWPGLADTLVKVVQKDIDYNDIWIHLYIRPPLLFRWKFPLWANLPHLSPK